MPLSLLDDEGALTNQVPSPPHLPSPSSQLTPIPQFEAVLREVFLRFASPNTAGTGEGEDGRPGLEYDIYENGWTASRVDLDAFARATNGQSMTDETFEEIETYFEMIDSRLSFKGFMQLYQLQAENDEEETSKDLEAWGYDLETLVLKQKVVEGNKKGGIEMGKEVGKGEDVKEN